MTNIAKDITVGETITINIAGIEIEAQVQAVRLDE